MDFVYIIIENGEPYPTTFKTYTAAIKAVKIKHKEYLEDQIKELGDLDDIESVLAQINVQENKNSIVSELYIEKGININIYKLPL